VSTSSGGRQQEWLQNWAAQHAAFEAIFAEEIAPGGLTSAIIDPVACAGAGADPRLTVLWGALGEAPAGGSEEELDNANNHSVVLRAELGRASLLISGDLPPRFAQRHHRRAARRAQPENRPARHRIARAPGAVERLVSSVVLSASVK
jgi:hypothetical protein